VVKAIAVCAALAMMMPVAGATRDQAGALKYQLRTKTRSDGHDMFTKTFTFTVSNPSSAEWDGAAPSCQTLDIVVTPADKPDEIVWQWSHGQMFCMQVTDIKIGAGGKWKQSEEWKFKAGDMKPGVMYRATATFLATKATATADFAAIH
jgi:hypothetical protein